MKFPAVHFPVNRLGLALACAGVFAIGACASAAMRSPGAAITRLDGTTIDTTALTSQIEALTRAANVQGLTVTIFNDRGTGLLPRLRCRQPAGGQTAPDRD